MEVYRTDDRLRKPEHQGDGALDEKAAAKFLRCSPRMLLELRRDGNAPPHYRIGNRVRYPKHLLLAWMEKAVLEAVPVWERRKPADQSKGGVA